MKTNWTIGMDAPQKAIMKSDFESSAGTRKRLEELLREKIESKRNGARSDENYSSPNWTLLQADAIGYERALFEVISLIS
jgi:hypothetical protein